MKPDGARRWHRPTPTRELAFEAASLRRATLADVPRLCELYRHARARAQETEQTMRQWLEHGGALMLEHSGAEGKVVCALRWREEDDGWLLDRVATLPEYRGQNFGRWLITKVEALAIQRNIPHLRLRLHEDREDLLAYYGRMGYVPVGENGGTLLTKRVGGVWQVKPCT